MRASVLRPLSTPSPQGQSFYPSLKEHVALTAGQARELSPFQPWLHPSPGVPHASVSWEGRRTSHRWPPTPDPLPAPSPPSVHGSRAHSGSGREQSPRFLPPYSLLLQEPRHAASQHVPIHLSALWLKAPRLLPGGAQQAPCLPA